MISNKLLDSILEVANLHASRIKIALEHVLLLEPITKEKLMNLEHADLGFLELLTSRFAKLQDIIGSKIFPIVLDMLQENTQNLSTLDRLHKLEKLEIIPNTQEWIEMRNTRNMVTHEYPHEYEITANNIKVIIEHAKLLLTYWDNLSKKILKLQKDILPNDQN